MTEKVSIYEQLANARDQFHALELRKSGQNKFAGYSYFELGDFAIPGMKCLKENGLVPVINFDRDYATMTIYDFDGNAIIINSPMAEANLKGCHPIQNLGAVETYQRRYLWMAALEIVEHDALDASQPVTDEAVVPEAASKAQWNQLRKLAEGYPRRESWLKAQSDNGGLTTEKAEQAIKSWKFEEAKREEAA